MKTDELYTHMHDAVDDAVRLGNLPAIGMADALAAVVIADAMPHLFEMLDMMREQAERQAAAMERMAAELVRVADGLHPTCEWPNEDIPDAVIAEAVNASIRDNAAAGLEDDDISGDMLRIANEFMDGMKADDQRAEDEQGYNAEVAKVAEFNKRWGFEK